MLPTVLKMYKVLNKMLKENSLLSCVFDRSIELNPSMSMKKIYLFSDSTNSGLLQIQIP